MADKYTESFAVPCYFTDCNCRLRPVSFMDMCQDIAGHAAIDLNFGDDRLMFENNAVWVLVRMKVEFIKAPQRWQRVLLETWHRGLQSIFFVRDYSLKDSEGDVLAVASSSWVVMDIDSRRVLRSDRVSAIPVEPQCMEVAMEDIPEKIVLPEDAQPTLVATHRVNYSDVDYNQHANNARYTAWAMDAVPEDVVYNTALKEILINFNKEIRPGQTVELYRAFSNGSYYVEGRVDGESAFCAQLTF